MDKFIGIGGSHWQDSKKAWNASFDYVAKVLELERPDLIMVEFDFRNYVIFSKEGAKPKAKSKRIEQGLADVKFDLTDEKKPLIYLDDLCMFCKGVASETPIEGRAAVSYALRNHIPVFFVDEPFHLSRNFSSNTRERGIIGFQNSGTPKYFVLLISFNQQRTTDGFRLKERNRFISAAAETLEEKFKITTLVSVGGAMHYFLSDEDRQNPLMHRSYGDKFTLPELIRASTTRVYDASNLRLVKDQPSAK